jgi:outer membrane receptor for ferrienterochelin and colicin
MNYPMIINVLSGVWLFGLSYAVIADQNDDQQRQASSAARKEQKLTDTPAALFVITQEDIRRSGITTLPEMLRLVPEYKWHTIWA